MKRRTLDLTLAGGGERAGLVGNICLGLAGALALLAAAGTVQALRTPSDERIGEGRSGSATVLLAANL